MSKNPPSTTKCLADVVEDLPPAASSSWAWPSDGAAVENIHLGTCESAIRYDSANACNNDITPVMGARASDTGDSGGPLRASAAVL